ncbi:hypothetical protein [uncultured Enterovirga sp.]|uniref:hypothetical protein n=1 Tax=uncultured Enterovirga sp. TaxID=2026352 RepID=UPI0035CBB46B
MPRKAIAFATIALGTSVIFVPGLLPGLDSGASAAPAQQVYTRKRVNGRWVSGRFTAGSATAATPGRGRYRLARRSPIQAPPVQPRTDRPVNASPRPSETARDLSTASLGAAPEVERMRPALEARARFMASLGAVPSFPVPDQAPAAALPAPRSVTFDLQRGTKTVTFGDDVAISEPFDPAAARDLTVLRPNLP